MEEEVQEVPEQVEQVQQEEQQVEPKVEPQGEKKKRSKVIEAPIAEADAPKELPNPKRMGRPVGAKDSKPRKKKEEPPETPAASSLADTRPPDPVYDYHEIKRQAVERAYRAQGEHWANLLSHLM